MADTGGRYRLVTDLQVTQGTAHAERGIARYCIELNRALLRRQHPQVARMVLNPLLPFPRLPPDILAAPELAWNTAGELRRTALADDRPLAYHLMSPFEISHTAEGDVPPHALVRGLPLVATLYDLIPLRLAERYLTHKGLEQRYRARLGVLQEAELVVTISEHTRRDAIELLGLPPERLRTIGAGVSGFFHPPVEGEDPRRLVAERLPAVDRPFVLTVSGGDARKNAEGLLSGWARTSPEVRNGRQLVIACKLDEGLRAAWQAHGEAEGLRPDDVVFTGWISDETLRALYQAAELFVFPSLYEGFGLPAAEAVACGCPVVVSSTSSLPEVLDWEPATFDPADPDAIAGAVERALQDEDFNAQLRARGAERVPSLTWDAVADRLLTAVDEVLPPATGPTRLRPRIAVVGPLPPRISGVADYNGRILPRLAELADIDVVGRDRPSPEAAALLPEARWFPPGALGRSVNPHAYDVLLYTVGNSDAHHDAYELALRWPGLVWLHDVRLAGLYLSYAHYRVREEARDTWITDRLREMYAERLPPGMTPSADDLPPSYSEAGLAMTRQLVDSARAVIVSSQLARQLLELDQGADAVLPRIHVLPLAAPGLAAGAGDGSPGAAAAPHAAGAPAALGVPALEGSRGGDVPVIASFGLVAPVKGTEVLVAALPHVRRRVAAHLVFVGPVGDGYREHLTALAREHGVADAVHLVGDVPWPTYRAWLRRASCAAQLRTATYGESSAAVLDCLDLGVPTLTSVLSARELPPGTVELVPPDVDAEDLADALVDLLIDEDRRDRLRRAGAAYARSWTVADVVDRLAEIIDELAWLPAGPTAPPPAD